MPTKLTEDFWDYEMRCKCGCGLLIIHPGFMQWLQAVRDELRVPMHVTSGCRCKEYNAKIGGHPKSLHICDEPQHSGQQGTLAVDIAAADGVYRGRLFAVAWLAGFSVGWNAKRGFLHLDRRDMVGLSQTSFDYR